MADNDARRRFAGIPERSTEPTESSKPDPSTIDALLFNTQSSKPPY